MFFSKLKTLLFITIATSCYSSSEDFNTVQYKEHDHTLEVADSILQRADYRLEEIKKRNVARVEALDSVSALYHRNHNLIQQRTAVLSVYRDSVVEVAAVQTDLEDSTQRLLETLTAREVYIASLQDSIQQILCKEDSVISIYNNLLDRHNESLKEVEQLQDSLKFYGRLNDRAVKRLRKDEKRFK
jgi:hypothetical protein